MRGGRGIYSVVVQPHNYRLYFDFFRGSLYTPTDPYKKRNSGSEDHFLSSGFRVVVRKSSVEVQYLGHRKQWRRVAARTHEGVDERLTELEDEFYGKCVEHLKGFIKRNGGRSEFRLLRKRKQDWGIHGDDFLDSLPSEMVITDSSFKKVYRDKVEFYGVAETKNFISNRALEDFSPEIAARLEALVSMVEESVKVQRSFIDEVLPVQKDFAENLRSHTEVIKGMCKAIKKFNRVLEQRKLSEWGGR